MKKPACAKKTKYATYKERRLKKLLDKLDKATEQATQNHIVTD